MCTAISYHGFKSHYFGRNLDLEYTYQEEVVVTPREFSFRFRNGTDLTHHFAMIGMATVSDGYPLYYEATNEKGLSMAGLNFPEIATYLPTQHSKDNIAPFELIPWVLGQCTCVSEARRLLEKCNIWQENFSDRFPLSPLHWIISDYKSSIVAEPMAEGLKIYDDPYGVLTNNPPFPYHMYHMAEYMTLSPTQAENRFSKQPVHPYSNGMGAIGLPGDFSSTSRFVRAAFVKENSVPAEDDISQFFHILSSVAMPRGSVRMGNDKYEITYYTSCCDTQAGIYYYTTYQNRRITAVAMHSCPLDTADLHTFALRPSEDFFFEN